YVTYNVQTQQVDRQFTPIAKRGDFAAMKGWTPLTSATEAALGERLKADPHANYLDLAKLAKTSQAELIPDTFLQTWVQNHRPQHEGQRSRSKSKFGWNRSDWQQLRRDLGDADDVSADADGALPDVLKVAATDYRPESTVMVFVNPALFSEVISRLANKGYVKLCGDGTYRLVDDGWSLLTLGVLTKHYSRDGTSYAFRTTFTPLIFAVANTERQETYECLFQAACAVPKSGVTLICQRLPGSACKRGARRKAPRQPKDEKTAACRGGLFSVAKKHLYNKKLEPREDKVVDRLQRFYFNNVPAQDARRLYGLKSWSGHAGYIWEATWWAGPERLQPGSASGTQAQESWRRRKLKKYLGNLRASIPVLTRQLQAFASYTLSQLRLKDGTLPDVPAEPFPDKWVLESSQALTRDGRTDAAQFYTCKAFATHSDA
ncbi:mak16-a, partial [Symbiodinium pilosum]